MEVAANDGAYVLRDVMRNVPLSADGEDDDIYITSVEAWGEFVPPFQYQHVLCQFLMPVIRGQSVHWHLGRRDPPLCLNPIPRLGPAYIYPRLSPPTRILEQTE